MMIKFEVCLPREVVVALLEYAEEKDYTENYLIAAAVLSYLTKHGVVQKEYINLRELYLEEWKDRDLLKLGRGRNQNIE